MVLDFDETLEIAASLEVKYMYLQIFFEPLRIFFTVCANELPFNFALQY
jgi:hypothetical protein